MAGRKASCHSIAGNGEVSCILIKLLKIELLGYGKVSFTRTAQGVVIDMPDVQLNKIAPVFKIKK